MDNAERGHEGKPSRRKAAGRPAGAAWIVYDMGNTLFFTGVVGLFFPLWVTQEMSGNDATVGYALSLAMCVVLLLGPLLGTVSDQSGRRMPYLAVSTIVCIGATSMIGESNLALGLALFAVAVIAVHTALIFYNALLVNVSTEQTRGIIAGFGVGVGYLGGFAERLRSQGVDTTQRVVHGEPAKEILRISEDAPNTAVAMVTHGTSGVGSWVIGTVTSRVIRYSTGPTLVVRAEEDRRRSLLD